MFELFIIIVVILSIFLSGLLSSTETAITAMSLAKIHKLKTDGNKQAVIISKLREDKESLISTILLANNGCNIFASTMATALLIDIFGSEGVIYATFIMTILIIIFAEILPKTYALTHPEKTALSFAKFLQITVNTCKPITKLISLIVYYILKVFKMESIPGNFISATEEIRGAIDLHHKEGSMDQSDKYMLDGVFYLGETKVSSVMTHRKNMQTININQDMKTISEQIKIMTHTRIPVWQDNPDNIIGILNTRDLLNALLENSDINQITLQHLITEPMFIHENTALDEQIAEFRHHKTKLAIVIDEYGDIQGMVTISDILEEIVGSIKGEHDIEKENIILQDDCCIVKGEVSIRDLNRMLNWNLPDEEASTIAGLLIHEAEKIPEVNEHLELYGFSFTVLTRESNQLTSIKIKKISNEFHS